MDTTNQTELKSFGTWVEFLTWVEFGGRLYYKKAPLAKFTQVVCRRHDYHTVVMRPIEGGNDHVVKEEELRNFRY